MTQQLFATELAKLNPNQRLAVDTIDGPVMVVAGPGTGKTQVLALRIANILDRTDTGADGILCLTFTNSGVTAMRDRLRAFIGGAAGQVVVSTFHAFGIDLITEHYDVLGYDYAPTLLDDDSAISLCDEILHSRDWQYLRPRANPAQYFGDIKSLISLLKRENLSPTDFETSVRVDIDRLKNDPDSISSRGPTKGNIKSEVATKIERLEKTLEVVEFYRMYDALKSDRLLIDYDDVLSLTVKLVRDAAGVADSIREKYLYVLVDEHQDSSGVQNEFLARVWGPVEQPNIFVVGDDRQLIYGFGGASLDYFRSFQDTFAGTKLITLTDNYRSTQRIVNTADELLSSELVTDKITGHRAGDEIITLQQCDYPRDEIIAASHDIKKRIDAGLDPNDCAVLVPKNHHVRTAMKILADNGLPVAMGDSLRLFEVPETASIIRILSIITNPMNGTAIAATLLDPLSGIVPMDAHRWLVDHNTRNLTIDDLLDVAPMNGLFGSGNSVAVWGQKLITWVNDHSATDPYTVIQIIGKELLLDTATDNAQLLRRVEVIRTLLHQVSAYCERHTGATITDILNYFDRLQNYEHDIPLAVFARDHGVRVMTMHASKGLEFQYVWIAHMNESTLMNSKHSPFALPESVSARLEARDMAVVKRQLYVAITRAKQYCTLSYATTSPTGGSLELARIIADMPESVFASIQRSETESELTKNALLSYVVAQPSETAVQNLDDIRELVRSHYHKTKVSVTLLNNFFECPWKWYFRSLLQLPEPTTNSLKFGSAVHETIEEILHHTEPVTVAMAIEFAHKHLIAQSRGDEQFVKSHTADITKIITRWVTDRLPEITHEFSSEKAYSFRTDDLPHLLITGKIDLIETLDPQNVRVTDFKTGSEKTKSEIEKKTDDGRLSNYIRQLAMYSYLINHTTHGNTAVSESRLEFLESKSAKNSIYTTTITSDHVDSLVADIHEYDQLIVSGQWTEVPCSFKSYGSGDECPHCALMKRLVG